MADGDYERRDKRLAEIKPAFAAVFHTAYPTVMPP